MIPIVYNGLEDFKNKVSNKHIVWGKGGNVKVFMNKKRLDSCRIVTGYIRFPYDENDLSAAWWSARLEQSRQAIIPDCVWFYVNRIYLTKE